MPRNPNTDDTTGSSAIADLSEAERIAVFDALMRRTDAELGGRTAELSRDYWMTRCLHFLSTQTEGTGRLTVGGGKTGQWEVVCAFGGGTSLVSVWGTSQRFSEDIDLLCLMNVDEASKNAIRRPHSLLTAMMFEASGADVSDSTPLRHHHAARFRQTFLRIDGLDSELKIETAVEPSDDSLFAEMQVWSILSRFATPDELAMFPELGGFVLPVVVPAYTVANKFDAIHRRTVQNDLVGITGRGRDLIDLDGLADSEHADEIRLRVPEMAERASHSAVRRVESRPAGGYGTGKAFVQGTAANEALRVGYMQVLEEMSWASDPTPFETAVERAASLDIE